MDLDGFLTSLDGAVPSPGASAALKALWHEAKGNWERAHQIVQDEKGEGAALVHAYLHRVEGDSANAAYWYGLAGDTPPDNSLDEEWRRIAAWLLDD